MFLLPIKTLVTRSMRAAFDSAYPVPQFRDLHVSIEMPIEVQHYPGIWVDFEPSDQLRTAGIDHKESIYYPDTDTYREVRRWRFSGFVTFTTVALSSSVRDALFDELVKVVAFGQGDPARSRFRDSIESNDLIGLDIDWDEVSLTGFTATPGTPWGTDDTIYEATARLESLGEFVAHPDDDALVPLSEVIVTPYTEEEGDPTLPSSGWI